MNVGDIIRITAMDENSFDWSGEIYAFVEQPPTPPGIHYTLLVVTGWYRVSASAALSRKVAGQYFSLTGKKTGGMDWCTVPPEDVPGHVWGELGRLQLTGGN